MINAINSNVQGASPLYLIYEDVGKLSKSSNSFVISHVKRGRSTVAHLVARWNTQGSSELVYMNSFPQSIIIWAELDLQ